MRGRQRRVLDPTFGDAHDELMRVLLGDSRG
jgi:hypothetical protein